VPAALQADPFTGTVFVFQNRRRTAIEVFAYSFGLPVIATDVG